MTTIAILLTLISGVDVDNVVRVLQARDLAQAAQRHFDKGEYVDAAADFEDAYRQVHDPRMLFNQAMCWAKLELWGAADRLVHQFLQRNEHASQEELMAATKLLKVIQQRRETEKKSPIGGSAKSFGWDHFVHDRKYPDEHLGCPVREFVRNGFVVVPLSNRPVDRVIHVPPIPQVVQKEIRK